jgi:hypothetical protein
MIEQVRNNPVVPTYWGKNQRGMVAEKEIDPIDQVGARDIWLEAAANAVRSAELLSMYDTSKELTNRLLEPFSHITTLITSTSWENFFRLRDASDAQGEIRDLARAIKVARDCSKPTLLREGEWHTPYAPADEIPDQQERIKVSTARCGRVSYNNHNGTRDISKDLELHDRLIGDLHFSPAEHQATPDTSAVPTGNLKGWLQYRKFFPQEYVAD